MPAGVAGVGGAVSARAVSTGTEPARIVWVYRCDGSGCRVTEDTLGNRLPAGWHAVGSGRHYCPACWSGWEDA